MECRTFFPAETLELVEAQEVLAAPIPVQHIGEIGNIPCECDHMALVTDLHTEVLFNLQVDHIGEWQTCTISFCKLTTVFS